MKKKIDELTELIMFKLGSVIEMRYFEGALETGVPGWHIVIGAMNYDKTPFKMEYELIGMGYLLEGALDDALENIKEGRVKSRDRYTEKILSNKKNKK